MAWSCFSVCGTSRSCGGEQHEHGAINSVAAWVLLQHSRLCATTSIHVRGRTTSAAQEGTAHEVWVTIQRKSIQSGHKPNAPPLRTPALTVDDTDRPALGQQPPHEKLETLLTWKRLRLRFCVSCVTVCVSVCVSVVFEKQPWTRTSSGSRWSCPQRSDRLSAVSRCVARPVRHSWGSPHSLALGCAQRLAATSFDDRKMATLLLLELPSHSA